MSPFKAVVCEDGVLVSAPDLLAQRDRLLALLRDCGEFMDAIFVADRDDAKERRDPLARIDAEIIGGDK